MVKSRTALTLALGTAFAASLTTVPATNATDNPFKLDSLKNGYQVAADGKSKAADKAKDGRCGGDKTKEGKCGGDK